MSGPQLALVLHGHLPFVRHPEYPQFLEEDWLFEAITETYVPLVRGMEALADQGTRFRLTMSVSPTLAAMLADPLLQERYLRRLDKLIELARLETERTRGDPRFAPLARLYHDAFTQTRRDYVERYGRNLVGALARLEQRGVLELITSGATHAFLPLLDDQRLARAQIRVAVAEHARHFGKPPRGIWLPECGYYEGLDRILADCGLRYFITDTHGVLHATPRPSYGVYAPIRGTSGVAAFGRDPESSKQVWSAMEGYPGDPDYREFYRDIGFDLDLEYLRPFLHDGNRTSLGMKYYRITGRTEHKEPYEPERARAKTELHAGDFVSSRLRQAGELAAQMPERGPLFVAPYDAELFGHWWFEGPAWLVQVLRRAAERGLGLRLVTPGDVLDSGVAIQQATPSASSWGDRGYAEVWLNQTNDWIYPHLHAAGARFLELASRTRDPSPLARRALAQAGRELLLAQSSDWAFIMRAGTHVPYAVKRTREHVASVMALCDGLERGAIDEAALAELESRHNLFPELDHRVFVDP